jgi:Na+/H+ antiporter NhaD/arsenite permease-like protein
VLTNAQIITLAIFGVTYVGLIIHYRWKLPIVLAACAVLLLWPGLMDVRAALAAVSWNVVLLYFGMLLLTETLVVSGAPGVMAEKLIREGASARRVIVLVCLVSGLISAVIENVAVVLIVAPIALAAAKRLQVSPVPILIGVAISSNLQGAATMIGDPPSMLLAGALDMNFNDFFWYLGRPSVFFAVELGAVAATLVLWHAFRKYKGQAPQSCAHKLESVVPFVLLAVLVAGLAGSSVLFPAWKSATGVIPVVVGGIAAVWWIGVHGPKRFLRQAWELDWGTGFFIIGVFILVGSLVQSGLVERFVDVLAGGDSGRGVFLVYTLLVWGSVAGSAVIDNVPFVAAMLPVCCGLAQRFGVPPELFGFGMMIGASVGGNITPVGASANIVACGIAKREGYHVSFREFMKLGLPFTVAGVVVAYIFLWVFWR